MAKYRVTWNVYSDAFVTKIASFNGIVGVADTWDGNETAYQLSSNYNAFTRHIQNGYNQYSLGKKYVYSVDTHDPPHEPAGLWLPLCWEGDYGSVQGYWECVFANGVIVRSYGLYPSSGWSTPERVTVLVPNEGWVYDNYVSDGRIFCILPFGLHGFTWGNYGYGGPYTDPATNSCLLRDDSGNFGYVWTSYVRPWYDTYTGRMCYCSDEENAFWKLVFKGSSSMDPYDDPQFEVEPDGGNPDPPEEETDPDFPPEPSFSATDSGMITLFNPDLTELQALASYMWSSNFDISQLFKIFGDPIDAILGLSITPVAVTHGSAAQFFVGNIATGVTMYKCAKQFESLDCGSLNVTKKYGSYLDYAPYTTAEIYLPFIGTLPIDINDIMGKTVRLMYRFDLISGACCAMIACGGKVLYTFVGQCSASIPITGHDWTNSVNGVLTIAASVASIAATQGAAAPTGIPAIASATINAAKQNIQKSGSLGGAGGMLGPLMPCLIITRPRAAWPKNLKAYEGYPSFISEKLGDIHGYTEVYKVHLEGIPATDAELTEIENILKGGVLL